jgi:hypothetical protein
VTAHDRAAFAGDHTLREGFAHSPGFRGIFVVYNEELNTLTPPFPTLDNRSLIVKVNRLFRF